MLSKRDLASGEVNATDDMEGVNLLLKTLHNSIQRKHMRVYELFEEKKSEEALQLRETIKELQYEIDAMMKSQMSYQKFLKSIGQDVKKSTGFNPQLKDQKSSLGAIVSIVPNK